MTLPQRPLGRSGPRSWPSASAAWACPTSTAAATTPSPSPPSTARSIWASHFLDTADMYGPCTQRGAGRPGDRRAARRGRARHQVRHRARPQRPQLRAASTAGPSTCRSACEGSLQRLGVDDHRPLLPAPRRPRDADRGDRRRHGRAGQQGKVRYLGLSEAAPATIRRAARRPPDHRAADRVLALEPRPRGRDPADLPRAGHRLRRLQPARPRLPHRPDQALRGPRARRLPPPLTRASRARTSRRTSTGRRASKRSPRRRAAPRPAGAGLGAGAGRATSCRSPAPSAATTWRRTSARSTWSSPPTTSPGSTRSPRAAAAGTRYPEHTLQAVNR